MGVDVSAVARVLGIEPKFQNLRPGGALFLPQRIYVIGQGATASTYTNAKFQATSANAVGDRVGYGSPLHRVAMQLLPRNGDGVSPLPVTFAPLQDNASGVASTGNIAPTGTPSETATFYVKVNETLSEAITVGTSDTVSTICDAIKAAVDAVLEMPTTTTINLATDVDFVSKWLGASANAIFIEIVGTVPGVTFTVTQPVGGSANPSGAEVTAALDLMGGVWETLVLNCLDIADTAVLDAIQTHGVGRWGTLERKPYVAFTGNTETTVSAATAVSDARKTDYINSQLVAPGSNELPFDVAARQLARIAKVANNNPARDYGSRKANGLVPGADEDQWDYAQRDQAVKAGSSTITVKDGVINIGDVVTFYHPSGDPLPAYRHVCDIIKLQNVLFNLDLAFNNEEWDGAPMIPSGQPTVNRSAKTPGMAKAVVFGVIDGLALNAIISNPDASKAATTANISSTNPKRLDIAVPIQIAGNTNIISADLLWGFYFGQPAFAAAA